MTARWQQHYRTLHYLCLLLWFHGNQLDGVNAGCNITDQQVVFGDATSGTPLGESRAICPNGTHATSCQCYGHLGTCNGAWFSGSNECTALNHGSNTSAQIVCTSFRCDVGWRVEFEDHQNVDDVSPSITCPDYSTLISCNVKDLHAQDNVGDGHGTINGNTCEHSPCSNSTHGCYVYSRCQAFFRNTFVSAAVDERCSHHVTISWRMIGDPISVPEFRIKTSPPTLDGNDTFILQGDGLSEMFDLETGRMLYTIDNIVTGALHHISVFIMDDSGGVVDRIKITSDDMCTRAREQCQNGATCCDDGEDYTCHCVAGYTGRDCQDIADPCDPNPCQNGGFCLRLNPGFLCSCPIGSGGRTCQELVVVPVESATISVTAKCTTAEISWQNRGLGKTPEQYEVRGFELFSGAGTTHTLCESRYPSTACLVTGLSRTSTYIFSVVSITGTDEAASVERTFGTTDTPSYSICPSNVEPVYADGVDRAAVWWEPPQTECLQPTSLEFSDHDPGDLFAVGRTKITYRLIDSAVVVDSCTFEVHVKERAVCTTFGDPHYVSLNGERYDFQGSCIYMLVTTNQSLPSKFNISVLHEPVPSRPEYSITKEVNVTIYDTEIRLMGGGEVRINGVTVRLPAYPVAGVSVRQSGFAVVVETDLDVYVRYDGFHHVVVMVPADPFKYQVEGLCGRYGFSGYFGPGGIQVNDVNEFGNSWSYGDGCAPTNASSPLCHASYGVSECGILTDQHGPFSGCHSTVNPISYYQSCLFDFCVTDDPCPAVETYARVCIANLAVIGDWRSEHFCPPRCGNGTMYRTCGPACMDTCVDPDAAKHCISSECVEGCFCPNGTVMDGRRCVDPAACGCERNGYYYSIGDVAVNSDCTQRCICTESRAMVCSPLQCHDNASCLIVDGTRMCVCKAPYYEGDGFICTRKCDDPDLPVNGGKTQDYSYPVSHGQIVSFYCDDGYTLHDRFTGECLGNWSTVCDLGTWLQPLPLCQMDCGDPGTPDNGYHLDSYTFPVCSGTRITFTCEQPRNIIGHAVLTCDDGSWDHDVPRCSSVCGDPGDPGNGHQSVHYNFPAKDRAVVYFDCDEGYALHDGQTGECLTNASTVCTNGSWSLPLPVCRQTCANPGYPRNGKQVDGCCYPACSGTEVTFECDEGYSLVGSNVSECRDGQWTSAVPSCTSQCQDIGIPDNGHQFPAVSYPVLDGTVISFDCSAGYRLHDPLGGNCVSSFTSKCEGHQWTNPLPLCLRACEDPGTPTGGRVNSSVQFPVCSGTSLAFQCDEFYFMKGDPVITCESGSWSHPLPVCQTGCSEPGSPNHGKPGTEHAYPVLPGTVVTFCCDDGYNMAANRAIVCREDGNWHGELPLCEPLCQNPGAPLNGHQVGQHEFPVDTNITVVFACDVGYTRHGPGFSQCDHGEWIPPPAESFCAEIESCCSDPCQNGGTCVEGLGRYDCICQPGFEGTHCEREYGVCYVWGDPHYITYDGEKYDFQGDCVYILTESATYGMTSFRVLANNQPFKQRFETLSVTYELSVIVYGQEIQLFRGGEVAVDGSIVRLPYNDTKIQIVKTGRYVSVSVDFGLVVRWDGYHYGDVKVPESYKGLVRGLCGNYNGDLADDFTGPEGRIMPEELEKPHRAAMFGNTWVANPDDCQSNARGCSPCTADIHIATKAYLLCSLLTKTNGPFSLCHEVIDPENFFSACMFDLCAKLPDKNGVCMNAEAYAQVCLDNGVVIDWRSADFCPIVCNNGLVYNNTVSPCLHTCNDNRPPYKCPEKRLVEGCTCPYGEVFKEPGLCIPLELCPCEYKGKLIEQEESIILDECDEECYCMEDGQVECIAVSCDPNAYCGERDGEHGCHCVDGYNGNGKVCTGLHCEPNPCSNGGSCHEQNTQLHFTCVCPPGFEGAICENEVDECMSGPCQNNGTCVDQVNSYQCLCSGGFVGDRCQIEIDECTSSPCQNDGTCIDRINHYQCRCREGYGGVHCETDIDECASEPCQNNATCVDNIGAYQCFCARGYHGKTCDIEINECDSTPCQNNGTCIDKVNSYECICQSGFEGIHCDTEIDECDSDPCQNNGACLDQLDSYECFCQSGYKGVNCETEIDECSSQPCQFGGTCVDHINAYTCLCTDGFHGGNCEHGPLCYSCSDAKDSENCNNTTVECRMMDPGCETELRHIQGGVLMHKGCKQNQECMAVQTNNPAGCSDGFNDSCTFCCQGNLCNNGVPSGHCLRNGTLYFNGSRWTRDETDACKSCTCHNNIVGCVDFIPRTYFNSRLLCKDDSYCPTWSSCQAETPGCAGDSCIDHCTDVSHDSDQGACGGMVSGSSDGCVVLNIGISPQAPAIPRICEEFADYVRNNVDDVSKCSDVDCQDISTRKRRRREADTTFRVLIEQTDQDDKHPSDVARHIISALDRDRANGLLSDALSNIEGVEAVINGEWTNWYAVTECSQTCGGGVRSLRRDCNGGEQNCIGENVKEEPCNDVPCPSNSTSSLSESGGEDNRGNSSSRWLLPTLLAIGATALICVVVMSIVLCRCRRWRSGKDNDRSTLQQRRSESSNDYGDNAFLRPESFGGRHTHGMSGVNVGSMSTDPASWLERR